MTGWFSYLQGSKPALTGQILGGECQVDLSVPQAVYFRLEDVRHIVFTESQTVIPPDGQENIHFRRAAHLGMRIGPNILLLEKDASRFAERAGFGLGVFSGVEAQLFHPTVVAMATTTIEEKP